MRLRVLALVLFSLLRRAVVGQSIAHPLPSFVSPTPQVHRSALSRTLALLEAAFHLPRAGATHAARRHHAKATSMLLPQPFDVAHIPTQVSVVRRAQHLQEQRLPLALALPVAHTTIARPLLLGNKACNKYKGYRSKWAPASCCSSYAASLSAGILQHLIIQPGRVVGCLDALWPLLLWSSFYVFLHTGACRPGRMHASALLSFVRYVTPTTHGLNPSSPPQPHNHNRAAGLPRVQ